MQRPASVDARPDVLVAALFALSGTRSVATLWGLKLGDYRLKSQEHVSWKMATQLFRYREANEVLPKWQLKDRHLDQEFLRRYALPAYMLLAGKFVP